jgi:hypothetical protein
MPPHPALRATFSRREKERVHLPPFELQYVGIEQN